MGKSTDFCIQEVRSETEHFMYRSPMKFGGRIVTDGTLQTVLLAEHGLGFHWPKKS